MRSFANLDSRIRVEFIGSRKFCSFVGFEVRLGGNLDSRDRSTIIVLFLSFFFLSRLELFRDRNSRWRNFFDSFVGFEVRLDLRIRDSFISE